MMKKILVFLAIGAGSSALGITASEIGKQYFPEYQPTKSLHCDALKIKFKDDKTSSFAGYVVSMPFYLTTQGFEASAKIKDYLKDDKITKRYGLDIQTVSFEKADSDFAFADFGPELFTNKQSVSFYFDRLEKYKTGICVRTYTFYTSKP